VSRRDVIKYINEGSDAQDKQKEPYVSSLGRHDLSRYLPKQAETSLSTKEKREADFKPNEITHRYAQLGKSNIATGISAMRRGVCDIFLQELGKITQRNSR
jgi:hypothetical protein